MKEAFFNSLETHFKNNCEGISPLQRLIREQAWKRFCDLGLPSKKTQGYQYFPFTQFYNEAFDLASVSDIPKEQYYSLIYPESRNSYFVFINGQYMPELSDRTALPKEVVVLRLRDALSNYGNFLQMRLSRALKEEEDPFATLNIAMVQMGLFIYIPPHIEVKAPIQCLNLISNDRPVIFNPRIHFFLGKRAKAAWTNDHVCLKDFEYISNGVIDIALEEGAHLEQYGLINPCPHGFCLESTRVTQKRDSVFKSLSCTSGTRSVRQDFRVSLMGENASCDLKGISLLNENRQAHVNVVVDHQAPHCTSHQLFKNVLSGNSKASFEGKILVQPKAQKTQAYQLNNNLLLGERASSNCKPNLEIFADDVKASHGATITQLNPEHLHYFKTRGISSETSKKLLISGFTQEIIQGGCCPAMQQRMTQVAEKQIG